ncbi:hypothetical protein LCGC14_0364030 [marine sediment metagenome]|uniref:Uncharacterized protein n=1 Tax=marine sediment metagenome TaxID=412755 RepID=A0A0F9TCW4_9ZZZZ
MPNERRVLAVPSTEDPSSSLNHRQKLADEYLEKALTVIKATMEGLDEKLAYNAAIWVAEMVMGKPKQAIEQTGGVEAEMARLLASAYAQHLQSQVALPPAVEDGVYVLGDTPIDTNSPDTPEPNDRIIEMVEKRPRKTFDWDELPE